MPNAKESTLRTLTVTIVLSLVCSIVVAAAAVLLKPKQDENKVVDIQHNILVIAGLLKDGQSASNAQIEKLFRQITPKLVDLRTGKFIEATPEKIQNYDQRSAAKNPAKSKKVLATEDIALIKRRADIAKVYVIEKKGVLKTLILPVHGYGLWSTLYGFMALKNDLNTVMGFGFYEQGETPGLGGEVDNPVWKHKWIGKQVYNHNNAVELSVIKGSVDESNALAKYQVDGLAGATLTSNGVSNLVHYWLGKNGFGPFIAHLKSGKT